MNPKSDIYSIGVLFWQLSSGCRPFYHDDDVPYDASLTMEIMEGKRENAVEGTPAEYINLYTGK